MSHNFLIGTGDDSESRFPSNVDKEEWEEEQKVNFKQIYYCQLVIVSVSVPRIKLLFSK